MRHLILDVMAGEREPPRILVAKWMNAKVCFERRRPAAESIGCSANAEARTALIAAARAAGIMLLVR
jgi:hypothetical protein